MFQARLRELRARGRPHAIFARESLPVVGV